MCIHSAGVCTCDPHTLTLTLTHSHTTAFVCRVKYKQNNKLLTSM